MNNEYFRSLFEHYLNNNITPDELLELRQTVLDEDNSELMDDALVRIFYDQMLAEQNSRAEEEAYDHVFSVIRQQQQPEILQHTLKKGRILKMYWLAGAAAMVLFTLAAGLLFYPRITKQQQVAHDIKPGANGATLTLANGTKLLLGGKASGKLAIQTGVNITKTENGELVYTIQASGAATGQPEYNTLATARKEQYQLILPDGTHVWLDAASSIKYPTVFAGNERRVELTGQAYFEVTHNAAKPFRVQTPAQLVEVLGTHFNLKSYPDESSEKTTLLEGAVRISSLLKPGFVKILKPGEQAINNLNGIIVNTIDTEEAVAWKNGYFMFDDEDLKGVMKKIARWYDVDVVYADSAQIDQVFAGSITRFTEVSKVLGMLQKAGNLHFNIQGRKIIVRK